MADRRRINGPTGGTSAPVFADTVPEDKSRPQSSRPVRTRKPNALRKMFLKTGVTPSASGSAYLELSPSNPTSSSENLSTSTSSLKLTCTVHGPRPLPKSAPFSPHINLTTHIKYAPFATSKRRGYLRDSTERDLGVHLETALRGVIIGDRWPKSGVEVCVTVLEGEEDSWKGSGEDGGAGTGGGWGTMSVLAGCVTVASAAIADAGIDCVDVVSGGCAAIVRSLPSASMSELSSLELVLDPVPSEHNEIIAACVIAYLPSRDEITDLWVKGDLGGKGSGGSHEGLTDGAVQAAVGSNRVLGAALRETAGVKMGIKT